MDISLPNSRRVAIYGRVSTEHEAQLSAFENQRAWYEDLAAHHPEWRIVERYFDQGITGTAAKSGRLPGDAGGCQGREV